MLRNYFKLIFFCCGVSLWHVSYAAPDAGSLQQQMERERQSVMPNLFPSEKEKGASPEKPLSGKSFIVREFLFEGNTLLSSEQLSAALLPCIGKPVDFERLKACSALVTEAYEAVGRVAKAVIPPQDIIDNKVKIIVIEAHFGEVVIIGDHAKRISDKQFLGIFKAHQEAGKPVNMFELDRAMLLADDIAGVHVSGDLDQGSQEGLTNLVLKLVDEPFIAGNASVDNQGSIQTGFNRANGSLNLNSPSRIGDLLSFNTMVSEGNRYLRIEETFPIGFSGLRVGMNTSVLNYKLIGADYSSLGANGTAKTIGISATLPIIRSRPKNLNLSLNLDNKYYFNQTNLSTTSDYVIHSVSLGLNGNLFDEVGGGGANMASLTWTMGDVDLSGSNNQQSDALTSKTQGHYSKVRYSMSRQQKLSSDWSFYANVSGQWTERNLDSSECFYLGGYTGVRAYPSNEGRGSQGLMVNTELRSQLGNGFAWAGFFDWGRVIVYQNNNFTGSASPNEFSLKGYGTALTWQSTKGSTIKATWSRRMGSNPNPGITGSDQDGTLKLHRVWLSASYAF